MTERKGWYGPPFIRPEEQAVAMQVPDELARVEGTAEHSLGEVVLFLQANGLDAEMITLVPDSERDNGEYAPPMYGIVFSDDQSEMQIANMGQWIVIDTQMGSAFVMSDYDFNAEYLPYHALGNLKLFRYGDVTVLPTPPLDEAKQVGQSLGESLDQAKRRHEEET